MFCVCLPVDSVSRVPFGRRHRCRVARQMLWLSQDSEKYSVCVYVCVETEAPFLYVQLESGQTLKPLDLQERKKEGPEVG